MQAFDIIIDRVISAACHGREVVDGINGTYKILVFHFMATVQLPNSQEWDAKMEIQISTHNYDLSLAQGFQKHFFKFIIQKNYFGSW